MTMTERTTGLSIPSMRVCDRLRRSLDETGASVQEIAEAMGHSRFTVSGWLNGKRVPNKAQMALWAHLTRVPVWWLATGAEEPPGDAEGAPADVARPKGLEPLTFWSVADEASEWLRFMGIVSPWYEAQR